MKVTYGRTSRGDLAAKATAAAANARSRANDVAAGVAAAHDQARQALGQQAEGGQAPR